MTSGETNLSTEFLKRNTTYDNLDKLFSVSRKLIIGSIHPCCPDLRYVCSQKHILGTIFIMRKVKLNVQGKTKIIKLIISAYFLYLTKYYEKLNFDKGKKVYISIKDVNSFFFKSNTAHFWPWKGLFLFEHHSLGS